MTFTEGAKDGKHYWLTPEKEYYSLDQRYHFDFDPCPYPRPEGFDGLKVEWGKSNYVNPPFGSVEYEDDKGRIRKRGVTAWVRKAIEEHKKSKGVVLVYPIDKWVLMLLAAGAKVINLGDVKWEAIEDRSAHKGTGRHIAGFILESETQEPVNLEEVNLMLARELWELKEENKHLRAELDKLATAQVQP